MIAIHIERVKNAQLHFYAKLESQRKSALKKLRSIELGDLEKEEVDYLNYVIALFGDNDIMTIIPDDIEELIKTFPKVPTIEKIHQGTKKPYKAPLPIKDKILYALNYTYLQQSFYPKYFQRIGIKACVYCNSQHTIVAVQGNSFQAKFEVDHYHSKDQHPYLSISPFNLYPSCSSCNGTKSNSRVHFELYTADKTLNQKSEFKFQLATSAKANYLIQRDAEVLTVKFDEPPIKPDHKGFNEVFRIEPIYNTQKDVIEELIIKSLIYNKSYKASLKNEFYKLRLSDKTFERFITGNYTNDMEMHKRPMSKFMMDIAKDLGIIGD